MGIFDGSFSIELNSPIDEESWKVIADAELDNTEHIYFTTPSGKRVDFIKADVIDEIRAKIENHCGLAKENHCRYCYYCNNVMGVREILKIIDKYKESEE
jgi:hypothetical protein